LIIYNIVSKKVGDYFRIQGAKGSRIPVIETVSAFLATCCGKLQYIETGVL